MGCTGSKTAAAAAAAAPIAAAPEGDYKLTVERTDDSQTVGLMIVGNVEPAGILVQAVKEDGLVPTYNRQHENTPEQQVREGDVIVAVNAVFGDFEEMKKELAQQKLTLMVKRPSATPADKTVQPKEEGETTVEPVAAAAEEGDATPAEAAAAPETAEAPAATSDKENAAEPEAAPVPDAEQKSAAVDTNPEAAVLEGVEALPEHVQKAVCCWGYSVAA
eukprot:TRINITY_DN9973_c0_g2_i1.p1 TRINITY_DN9973_c0_g2~~TRINITY_DN9973_c0_g2_i1.p1  ORF type:complete len:245 (-),score=81.06 TRINITY_DN9973_c0_g2_i1:267-923(-)